MMRMDGVAVAAAAAAAAALAPAVQSNYMFATSSTFGARQLQRSALSTI